jgi:hypothetical protein
MRRIAIIIIVIALLLAGLASAGCARRQQVSADPLGIAPTDFSIEATVLTGEGATVHESAHLRQSRYVLFADGSFHYGEDVDREQGADWLPPLTRVLTRKQLADVWSLAQRLGFTDPDNAGGSAINFKLIEPQAGGVTHIVAFRGWGERWSFVHGWAPQDGETAPHGQTPSHQPDSAMTQLVRELARLAWASDRSPVEAVVMPTRYDFGPDPYERFRQPGGATAAMAVTQERSDK